MNKVDWREMWLRSVIIVCLGIAGMTVCCGFSGCNNPPITLYQHGNVFECKDVGVIKSSSGDQILYMIKIEKHYYYATRTHGCYYVIGPEIPDDVLTEFKKDLEF